MKKGRIDEEDGLKKSFQLITKQLANTNSCA